MISRKKFAKAISSLSLSPKECAIAFLWYYRISQEFDYRSTLELANDLHDEGFPRPNITRLKRDLLKSRYVIRGKIKETFQLNLKKIDELDEKYYSLLKIKKYVPSEIIIPSNFISNTRNYLESMVHQINSCYDLELYDACAVIMRRLMESLIIEVYISYGRQDEIKNNGIFLTLEKLIKYIANDQLLILSRGLPKIMNDIKEIGDTAAHDRLYVTQEPDINDLKFRYRKLIRELLDISGIKK